MPSLQHPLPHGQGRRGITLTHSAPLCRMASATSCASCLCTHTALPVLSLPGCCVSASCNRTHHFIYLRGYALLLRLQRDSQDVKRERGGSSERAAYFITPQHSLHAATILHLFYRSGVP